MLVKHEIYFDQAVDVGLQYTYNVPRILNILKLAQFNNDMKVGIHIRLLRTALSIYTRDWYAKNVLLYNDAKFRFTLAKGSFVLVFFRTSGFTVVEEHSLSKMKPCKAW